MNTIEEVKKSSYSLYEALINKRDKLRKDAFSYDREYVRVFGELILAVFNKKIECIQKKKIIEFCQKAVNRDEPIDQSKLETYLQSEMAEFREKLGNMQKDYDSVKDAEIISQEDYLEIKRIYRRIAKKIHPDMNPQLADNDRLMDLWNRVVASYNSNDLKLLRELEFLVMKVLQEIDLEEAEVEIPDIEEKIEELEEEIEHIKTTVPYLYKELLEDEDAVNEKKLALSYELKEYEEYSLQLDDVLKTFVVDGVIKLWEMK